MNKPAKIIYTIQIVFLPFFLFCQNIDKIKKKNEIIPLLCHNWNIGFKIDSLIKQYPPAETPSTIHFISNGGVIIKTISTYKGTWDYDIKNHYLYIKLKNEVQKLKILKLTNKEIIFEKNNDNGLVKEGYLWRDDL